MMYFRSGDLMILRLYVIIVVIVMLKERRHKRVNGSGRTSRYCRKRENRRRVRVVSEIIPEIEFQRLIEQSIRYRVITHDFECSANNRTVGFRVEKNNAAASILTAANINILPAATRIGRLEGQGDMTGHQRSPWKKWGRSSIGSLAVVDLIGRTGGMRGVRCQVEHVDGIRISQTPVARKNVGAECEIEALLGTLGACAIRSLDESDILVFIRNGPDETHMIR